MGNGKIGLTFCPGKKQLGAISGNWDRDLDTDLAAIRDWGASDVVSLIETDELIDLCVENLSEGVRGHDIRWHHLPIVDQNTPDEVFETAWVITLPVLAKALQEGRGVLVHCKGGLGRAGTIAAALLLISDETLTSTEAIERLRTVRPGAIENRMQEMYVTALRD